MTLAVPAGPRIVRAPRGSELSTRGWQQEAALRMLMNNLDPDVAERPDDLVVYGGTGRAAAQLGCVRRDRAGAADPRGRRDAARAERQAGGGVPYPRVGAASADRQQQPGRALGELGHVSGARTRRADHVRADDRGLVDLHRHAGNPAGDVRDVRGAGTPALRRHAPGTCRAHRRVRRHGRGAAPGGDDERGRRDRRSRRRSTGAPAARDGVHRSADGLGRRGAGVGTLRRERGTRRSRSR